MAAGNINVVVKARAVKEFSWKLALGAVFMAPLLVPSIASAADQVQSNFTVFRDTVLNGIVGVRYAFVDPRLGKGFYVVTQEATIEGLACKEVMGSNAANGSIYVVLCRRPDDKSPVWPYVLMGHGKVSIIEFTATKQNVHDFLHPAPPACKESAEWRVASATLRNGSPQNTNP